VRSPLFLLPVAALAVRALAATPAPQSSVPWRDPSPHQVRSITVDSSVKLEVFDWGGSGTPIVLREVRAFAQQHGLVR
jgi:hypothetical protein